MQTNELTPDRARDLLNRFADCRVLVVGDLMLDRYVEGEVVRISPEAPVPVLRVTGERSVPGGACNVGLNVTSLGGEARVYGRVGCCGLGDDLLAKLETAGVDTSGVWRDPDMTTIVKTRIMSDRQQMLRVDREPSHGLETPLSTEALAKLDEALQDVSAVVLEDYGKGVLQQPVVSKVLEVCRERSIPTGYDPKDNHELDVRGITVATPNRKEAFQVSGVRDRSEHPPPLEDTALRAAGDRLHELWQPEHLLITLGPQGMWLQSRESEPMHLSTRAQEVYDVSGAGDTVIATTLLTLAAGGSFHEAAELANIAAGIVVGKLGTATVSCEELLAAVDAE